VRDLHHLHLIAALQRHHTLIADLLQTSRHLAQPLQGDGISLGAII
jgi:hypothetical protein